MTLAFFYDEVVVVGSETMKQAHSQPVGASLAVSKPLKAATTKESAAASKAIKAPALRSSPSVKSARPTVPTKKDGVSASEVTAEQILKAAPLLRAGQLCTLTQVAVLLRAAKLLGPNASSVKFFKSHLDAFSLAPSESPSKVRYLGSAAIRS